MFSDIDEYDALELDEIIQPEAAGQEHLDLPIEALDLSERPRNCLRRAQVQTVGELIEKSEEDLLNITNFGQKSLEEVVAKLDELGFSLQSLADADPTESVVRCHDPRRALASAVAPAISERFWRISPLSSSSTSG